MNTPVSPLGRGWTVNLRVWVENAGRAVLGSGRLELLEGIDRWHSISAAARQMGMSYRHAWQLVQKVNQAAGTPLVVTATGGSDGGGADLTPEGQQAVMLFREIQDELRHRASTLLPRCGPVAGTTTIHIAAALSLDEVLGQLLTDYSLRHPGVRGRAIYGASDELAEHLLAGTPVDAFITADARQLRVLQAAGLVGPTVPYRLAENSLAAIAPADHSPPIGKSADLARPGAGRVVIAAPSSPLGRYTRLFLQRRGLYETIRQRTLQVENSRAVVAAVRAGQADVGLVYGSDLGRAADCRLLFRVRRGPAAIRYTSALLRRGQHPEEARQLLAFLSSPEAAERFRRCGFFPLSSYAG